MYINTGATIVSHEGGSGSVYNITCSNNTIDCRRTQVTPSNCNHLLDFGVRCQTYLEGYRATCDAEINKRLSSLTTALPPESPTQPATITTNLTEMTQCPICHTDSETPTEDKGGSEESRNALNNSNNDTLLVALLGLLGVILAAVLTGWIMTCVYFKYKINRYKW